MYDAAIVIPHYDDSTRLRRCLAALVPQLDAAVEVVVVDNGTPDRDNRGGLAMLAADFPAIRFVTEPGRGAALARNRGVAETSAPWIFFLDADCLPAPDWLAQARRLVTPDAVIGGRIDLFDETPPPRSGAEAFEAVFAFDQQAYIRDKGFSVTANLLTSRAVFARTGPMRAGLSEDLDWCRRAVAAGAALSYADALRVGHPARADWAALARKWRRLTEESYGLTARSPKARLVWAARALLMPASAAAHLPRILRHEGLTMREKRAAAATLLRLRLARMGWMLGQALTGLPRPEERPPASFL